MLIYPIKTILCSMLRLTLSTDPIKYIRSLKVIKSVTWLNFNLILGMEVSDNLKLISQPMLRRDQDSQYFKSLENFKMLIYPNHDYIMKHVKTHPQCGSHKICALVNNLLTSWVWHSVWVPPNITHFQPMCIFGEVSFFHIII
jgi:hypothetical protein